MSMTLEEFVATKVHIDDLKEYADLAPDQEFEDTDGLTAAVMYLDYQCFILEPEPFTVKGELYTYLLTLGSEDYYSNDLADLEPKLYEWAMAEGLSL